MDRRHGEGIRADEGGPGARLDQAEDVGVPDLVEDDHPVPLLLKVIHQEVQQLTAAAGVIPLEIELDHPGRDALRLELPGA